MARSVEQAGVSRDDGAPGVARAGNVGAGNVAIGTVVD